VNVFKVSSQVATLCESLVALRAVIRPKTRMLPEMVAQVATLFEG